MDWLKTILSAAGAAFALAVVLFVAYLFIQPVLSLLKGAPVKCYPAAGEATLSDAFNNLCQTTQIFIGTAMMILIVIGGVVFALSSFIAIYEILSSKCESSKKMLWGALFLLSFVFAPLFLWVLAYYFIDRKKIKSY